MSNSIIHFSERGGYAPEPKGSSTRQAVNLGLYTPSGSSRSGKQSHAKPRRHKAVRHTQKAFSHKAHQAHKGLFFVPLRLCEIHSLHSIFGFIDSLLERGGVSWRGAQRLGIDTTDLLTFRFERFVESYIAMWDVLIKRHAEEDLRWHPLMHKS